ncbi:uncharacterized protein LOC131684222 [Topomyia yanbarensis]|uniref:uncharacterized protein LOC131684222 n=1 Tax=Topomyia yanbarensis TaxID=2498891 RepID=UPI00273CE5D0|nr:uncharacterized protein LOC131684222 [Topomyia yanbarensis]
MVEQQTATAATVILLLFSILFVPSNARITFDFPEKLKTLTLIHGDDNIMMQSQENRERSPMETDADNEVISVRLLNRYSTQFTSATTDLENVSYENIQDSRYTDTSTNKAVSTVTEPAHDTTDSTTLKTEPARDTTDSTTLKTETTPIPIIAPIIQDSFEHDWEHSREDIPESLEPSVERFTMTIKPIASRTSTQRPHSSTAVIATTSTTPTMPPETKNVGERKRVARKHDDYHRPPGIDLRRLNIGNLDGFRFQDLFSHRSIPESIEQPAIEHHQVQPHASLKTGCPCAKHGRKFVDYDENEDDYPDYEQSTDVQFPRMKRLLAGQSPMLEENLPATDLSIERAERMQGALERIMGIVTIISHVDNFIQKKTKQSIRRLARLYESSEE